MEFAVNLLGKSTLWCWYELRWLALEHTLLIFQLHVLFELVLPSQVRQSKTGQVFSLQVGAERIKEHINELSN